MESIVGQGEGVQGSHRGPERQGPVPALSTTAGCAPCLKILLHQHLLAGATKWAGPELGEHTDQILRDELDMSAEQIQHLRAYGAV